MKKTIVIIAIIAIIAVLGWVLMKNGGADSVVEGTITSIDTADVAVDGPVLIEIETEDGEETIAVPSMGINLCAARENIADAFALEVGEAVQARGVRDDGGYIIPCESADHYLRVVGE